MKIEMPKRSGLVSSAVLMEDALIYLKKLSQTEIKPKEDRIKMDSLETYEDEEPEEIEGL